MDFARVLVALVCSDPADISHGGIITFYMKLIFQADGQSVQWTYWFSVFLQIIIELVCPLECLIEENLMETVILFMRISKMIEKN